MKRDLISLAVLWLFLMGWLYVWSNFGFIIGLAYIITIITLAIAFVISLSNEQ